MTAILKQQIESLKLELNSSTSGIGSCTLTVGETFISSIVHAPSSCHPTIADPERAVVQVVIPTIYKEALEHTQFLQNYLQKAIETHMFPSSRITFQIRPINLHHAGPAWLLNSAILACIAGGIPLRHPLFAVSMPLETFEPFNLEENSQPSLTVVCRPPPLRVVLNSKAAGISGSRSTPASPGDESIRGVIMDRVPLSAVPRLQAQALSLLGVLTATVRKRLNPAK
eukprot:gnl/Dysnectes_brevis/3126_a3890_1112.p1 GENE.gnl/Dysnectes_brevis/3126_a3890_1112~~gnl/Dysnectes_brevis/3126_a3890_1112.p1  ORF type:complete len:227 (-),score=29.10 gnl/Dysnectes_brevis/3126_a3890_1112:33-713(-)